MSNQPASTRPWFRLASISRPAPQEPALPRSATIRPAFSPPTQAQPNAAAPPPPAGIVSSVPPSPADKKPTVPVNASTSLVSGSPVKTVPTTSAMKPMYTNTTAKVSPAKYSSDSEDAGMRIITITGDNKGAFMEINQSAHHKKGFQGSPHRLNSSSSEAGDGKMKSKSNWTKKMPMNAFINSNVQGINNSIVFNSSCACHDPGVHLTLYNS